MPTPNLYVTAGREPFEQIAPELRTTRVNLLYVTDRIPAHDEQNKLVYGHGRSRSMAFGSATVEIGKGATWEALAEDSQRRERSQPWYLRLVSVQEFHRFPETPFPFTYKGGHDVDGQSLACPSDSAPPTSS